MSKDVVNNYSLCELITDVKHNRYVRKTCHYRQIFYTVVNNQLHQYNMCTAPPEVMEYQGTCSFQSELTIKDKLDALYADFLNKEAEREEGHAL